MNLVELKLRGAKKLLKIISRLSDDSEVKSQILGFEHLVELIESVQERRDDGLSHKKH